VPRELVVKGGREMKLIGIKSSDIEYENVVNKGDILICGKDMPPSPGDLCLMRNGDNVVIAPFKEKGEYIAVIIPETAEILTF